MSNQLPHPLATKPVGKLLWTYSIPAIVGTLVMSLYNVVDRIFLGQGVGPLALSGLALTFPFMIVLLAFGLLVGSGSSSRISITLGENNIAKAEKILGNAFTLTLLISSGVITLSLTYMDELLRAFGGTDQTLQYARDFMWIIVPANILTTLNFGFNNIMRASGHPRKAMIAMVLCSLLNIGLDALFIFVFKWGIKGAAIATAISYFVGAVWSLSHFMLESSNLRFRWENLKLEKEIVLSILSIGMSPFSMQVATSFVAVAINSTLLKYGGDLAIGAYGIVNSFMTLVLMVIIGLNQGMQPIIGYNYGAKSYDRMFEVLKLGILVGTILTTIGFVVGTWFSEEIVGLFTSDPSFQQLTAHALRISVMMFAFIGFQIVVSNFFQSIGKAKISIALSLTRQIVFLIPAILILPRWFGLDGTWAVMPLSDGLSFVVTVVTFWHFMRRFGY